jgi:putative oxidoreductase
MAQGQSTPTSIGLLVIRLAAGGMLLYGHGWAKLAHYSERAPHFPDPLHIGHPRSLMLNIFAEVICAGLVILGFATRFAAIALIVNMFVAEFVANTGTAFSDHELGYFYLASFIALLFTGPGALSLDSRFGPSVSFKGAK